MLSTEQRRQRLRQRNAATHKMLYPALNEMGLVETGGWENAIEYSALDASIRVVIMQMTNSQPVTRVRYFVGSDRSAVDTVTVSDSPAPVIEMLHRHGYRYATLLHRKRMLSLLHD